MVDTKGLVGKYYGKETITYYNTTNGEITYAYDEYGAEIKLIGDDQYLMNKVTLNFNNKPVPRSDIFLLFVKDSNGWISSSYPSGVDKLYYENGQLYLVWSDTINEDGVIFNGKSLLTKIE